MNRLYFPLVSVTVLLFAGLTYSGENDSNLPNPYVTTYPFKSAVIQYNGKIESGHGKTTEGTEVVYIKKDMIAKAIKMTVPVSDGKTKEVDSLQIITPEYVYILDLVEKKGIKIENSKKYGIANYETLSKEEKEAFHERMKKRGIVSLDLLWLGKKIGKETVLGRKCDVYEAGEKLTPENMLEALEGGRGSKYMKSWIWSEAKIPLKIKTEKVGYSSELVVKKIEENVKIPDSKFSVPPDIEVVLDTEKSEASLLETQSRFYLLKTGRSKIIRKKVEKEIIKPEKSSEKIDSEKKDKKSEVKN